MPDRPHPAPPPASRHRGTRRRTARAACLALLVFTLLGPGLLFAQARSRIAGNQAPEDPPTPQAPDTPPSPTSPRRSSPGEGAGLLTPLPEAGAPGVLAAELAAFAAQLDLGRFRTLAVFDGGRAKIVDTLAREVLERIHGRPVWRDPETGIAFDPVFTYLDLLTRPGAYVEQPLIHVEVLPLRRRLVRALVEAPGERPSWLTRGRLTPRMLARPAARRILNAADADLRLADGRKQVVRAALAFHRIGARLLMVSPAPGREQWHHPMALGEDPGPAVADPEAGRAVLERFRELGRAWRARDAEAAQAALDALAGRLPALAPQTYPPAWRRHLERFYNASHRFTFGYLAYGLATLALLVAFQVRRRWLTALGAALLALGVLTHTLAIATRMILADRGWLPLHNQYESYIALSWFAVLTGVALMVARRQWLFGAAAAALGTGALLVADLAPIPSAGIGRVAGILATSNVLKVHVTTILAAYGLIGLGFFVSLFYLLVHYSRSPQTAELAAAGLSPAPAPAEPNRAPPTGRAALLQDLDRAQMTVLQLAFWILGVGILLGAYWADHAWGRWWGWDPKETWALITWMVYLAVIHLRLTVRRRGLVTAWLSILGFCLMLWTYWGVNLVLSGLHSYA